METSFSPREQGMRALETGDLDQAIEYLSQAVLRDTSDAETRAQLGVAYGRKGLHPQARRALQSALGLQPANPEYRCLLGAQWEREGDTAKAVAAYREALRLRADHPTAMARLELLGLPPNPGPAPAPAPPPSAATVPPQPAPGATTAAMQCGTCREWSQPGQLCEWCGGSLVTVTTPPPRAAPVLYAPPPIGRYGLYAQVGPLGRHKRAHRGGSALTLGILSLIMGFVGLGCGLPAIIGLTCGILATSIGGRDLAEIHQGLVQEYGAGALQGGRVLGIIGIVLSTLALIGWTAMLLLGAFAFGV